MHQARMLPSLVSRPTKARAAPYSRPSGRNILYARRSMAFVFPSGITVVTSSEYTRTALVFSSYAGRGALAAACIQAGASATTSCGHESNAFATARPPTSTEIRLIDIPIWPQPLPRVAKRPAVHPRFSPVDKSCAEQDSGLCLPLAHRSAEPVEYGERCCCLLLSDCIERP